MPTTVISAQRPRRDPVAVHAYTLPVVRELPSQPAQVALDLTW